MKNRLFQRLSAFAVAGAMAVSFAAVPVAATEVPEHEHNWVSQVTKVATCQEPGFEKRACDCGAVETKELPQKTEHTYNAEGKCTVCGTMNPALLTNDTTDTTKTEPGTETGKGTQTDGVGGEQAKTDGGEGQPTENKGENTEISKPTEGKGETNETSKPTEGKDETTETSKPTEGKDETNETAKPTEGNGETTGSTETTEGLTEEEQAAQESAKRVAEVQALIDALRTEVPEEELEAEKAKFDAVTAALATLTEEEKAKLNLTNYQALEKLLALLPATLEEKVGPVTTEEELRKAIEQGGDVVLANDITLTRMIEIGKDKQDYPGLNLDLAGHAISSEVKKVFEIHTTEKVVIRSSADKKGTITTSSGDGRCVDARVAANVELSNLTLSVTGGGNTQVVNIGGAVNGANLVINNCTISAGDAGYAVMAFRKSTINISGSDLSGFAALYMSGHDGDSSGTEITVSGSTLTGNNPHGPSDNDFGTIQLEAPVTIEVKNKSTLVANGTGDYSEFILGANNEYLAIAGANVTIDETTTIQLAGHEGKNFLLHPYFYADNHITENTIKIPSKYASMLDADLKLDADNRVVQKINSEERLRAAIEKGGTVTVDADIELTQPLVIANGKTVTLDLNGKTLSDKAGSFGGQNQPDSLVIVDNGGSLTVTGNGTIRSSVNGIKMTQDSTKNDKLPAKLVVENGTITAGDYYAIAGNGSRHNTDITINGGTISATYGGIFHPQDGKLTINGGSITGGEFGVEMRAGELNINGGSITATAKNFEVKPNGNGSTSIGVAVAVVPHTTGKNVSVTISGGTLTGNHALNEAKVETNSGTVSMSVSGGDFKGKVDSQTVEKFITGGTFKEPPKEALAKDHFSFEKKPDGTFELKEDPHISDGNETIYPANPNAPVSLDGILTNNEAKDAEIVMDANGEVKNDHTMSGNLTMEVNGHKITGSGSISGKLTLKDLNAKGTHLALPQGGKVTFQNGSVQVTADAVTNTAGNSVGYSKPIQITHNGHDYTYFLAIGGSNDGKLSIDANGKPIVTGQHYVVKAKTDKIEKFTMTGIYNGSVTSNDFYKNTNATLQFVTDAPATALEVGFVTVDGKQITDSSCFSVTSGDTAAVTLSNKYLRSLSIGVHTLQMHFKDGKTVYGIFSVRTTSNADSSNPKTGDTIFLPIAVMTLSLTALAVLMPRKKKFF